MRVVVAVVGPLGRNSLARRNPNSLGDGNSDDCFLGLGLVAVDELRGCSSSSGGEVGDGLHVGCALSRSIARVGIRKWARELDIASLRRVGVL